MACRSHRLPDGAWGQWLDLRPIEVEAYDQGDLLQLLRRSFDVILQEVYGLPTASLDHLDDLWSSWADSGQLVASMGAGRSAYQSQDHQ